MKKTVKSTIAIILAAIMLMGIVPIGAINLATEASAKDISSYSVGDTITYGSYPQSKVTDSSLISALETKSSSYLWVDYGYYSGTGKVSDGNMKPSDDMMYYKDISYNGNMYRAVWIKNYRPYCTGYTSPTSNTYQDDNGYTTGNVYYFKYEPLTWRVLDPSEGFVMCSKAIDSQAYQNFIYKSGSEYYNSKACTNYASDWATSSIREWLNNDFYYTAFSDSEKSQIGTTYNENKSPWSSTYDSANTSDKIFLLSYNEVLNSKYGFSSSYSTYDTARQLKSTDYAKCQGCYQYTGSSTSYNGNSWWRLRSPISSDDAAYVSYGGDAGSYYCVDDSYGGIVPAFKFNPKSTISSDGDYKLTINANGGTFSNGEETKIYYFDAGENITPYQQEKPTKTGYLFDGWDTILLTMMPERDVTYTAKWKKTEPPYICIYSTSDDFSVYQNESFGLSFSLYQNGTPIKEFAKMALVVGNSEVISISDYKKTDDGKFTVDVKGLKPGTSSLTITDSETKAYKVIYVTVYDEDFTDAYSARIDTLTGTYYDGIKIYGKNNGLYVTNLNYSNKSDGTTDVSFDVYNTKNHIGAVEVYDKDGNWKESIEIARYTNISGFFDVGEALYRLCSDTVDGTIFTFADYASSKKTSVSFNIPSDGYFVVSNNAQTSPGTFLYNVIDLAFFAIEGEISGLTEGVNNDSYKWKDIAFKEIKKEIFSSDVQSGKFIKRVYKDSLKSLQKIFTSSTSKKMDSFAELVDVFNENYSSIMGQSLKSIAKSASGYGEDVFEQATGPIGAMLKTLFSATKLIDRFGQVLHMTVSLSRPEMSFYMSKSTASHTINGVSVETNNNIDSKAILQVFHIVPKDEITVSLNGKVDFDNYELYNICFVKDETKVQPNGKVTVKIPIPDGMDKNTCSILRKEENGTWTIINAKINGNYLEFETDHFSYYALTGKAVNVEINTIAIGNGTVSESMVVTSGDYVTISATPNDGNMFAGWYNGETLVSGEATYSFVAKENVNLVAKFEISKYIAKLMVDGKLYKEIQYNEGQKSISLPPVPEKDGYTGVWESYSLTNGGTTINAIYTPIVKPSVKSVQIDDITLNYKQSTTLKPTIAADDDVKYTVEYKSSDTSAATVDKDGNITTHHKGSTTITCTVKGENGEVMATDTCKVTVKFSFGQWLIWILLLGFLWY